MRLAEKVLCVGLSATVLAVSSFSQNRVPSATLCNGSTTVDHQLPLEPHETEFKYSQAPSDFKGSWQVRSQDGAWPAIPGEWTKKKNLWVSRQSDCGECLCAALDFGEFFGLWRPGQYQIRWIAVTGDILIGPITLVLEEPQGTDAEAYKNLLLPRIEGMGHPKEQNALLYGGKALPGNPPIGDRLLCTYPTSTYAARWLWRQGRSLYESYPEMGAEKDFNHDAVEKKLRGPRARHPAFKP